MTSKWNRINEDDFQESWESMLGMLDDETSLSDILHPEMNDRGSSGYHGAHVYHHSVVLVEDHPYESLGCLNFPAESTYGAVLLDTRLP